MARGFMGYQWSLNFLSVTKEGERKKGAKRGATQRKERK